MKLQQSMRTHQKIKRMLTPAGALVVLALGSAGPVHAQQENESTVESTVTLGPLITYIGPGILPGTQPAAYVTTKSRVTLVAMPNPPEGATFEWFSDAGPVVGSANKLELGVLTKAGKIMYQANVVASNGSVTSRAVDLFVIEPGARLRLANLSTRVRITHDAPVVINGFVVEKQERSEGLAPRRVLIRAVGPTLTDFGVAEALADPQLRIFNADGTPYEWPPEIAVVDPSRDPVALAVKVGAFPLRPGAADFAAAPPLPPGGYTLHVSSIGGGDGDVLVEVYEIPEI